MSAGNRAAAQAAFDIAFRGETDNIDADMERLFETEKAELLDYLKAMVEHYVQLAGCGDCGNWNPEEEGIVINARAAIARATS